MNKKISQLINNIGDLLGKDNEFKIKYKDILNKIFDLDNIIQIDINKKLKTESKCNKISYERYNNNLNIKELKILY